MTERDNFSTICVLHTAASAGLRYFHVVIPANGISALTDFGQALIFRQVSWLYTGSVVRSTEDIQFEDIVTVEIPKRRLEWCWQPRVEGVSQTTPRDQRIPELEAQLCERDAIIAEMKAQR